MTEYIIVGDTENYKECLVYVCKGGRELAEQTLSRMLNNPNKYDKEKLATHTNLRIKPVEEKDQWWNDPFFMSD